MRLLLYRAVKSPLVVVVAVLFVILTAGAAMTTLSRHPITAGASLPSSPDPAGRDTMPSTGSVSAGSASPASTGVIGASLRALSAEQIATPEAFIAAVMTQVLTIDYAHTSRLALQNWVDANQAIVHMAPSPPQITADMLRHSAWNDLTKVRDSGSPLVVSASEWAAYARAGAVSSVRNVQVTRDAAYDAKIAAGAVEPGPYVTDRRFLAEWDITIAGTVTHRNLSLMVGVDLALLRGGYGLLVVL